MQITLPAAGDIANLYVVTGDIVKNQIRLQIFLSSVCSGNKTVS